jgi:predicted phage tail protein
VAGADHYDVWVDDQSTGQTAVLRNQAVTGASWIAPTPLKTGDSYSWQMRAIDVSGTVLSPWSKPLVFRIAALPAPTPTGPGSAVLSAQPTFTWNPVSGADHYDVWADDTSSGQSDVLRNQRVAGTSWTATSSLQAGDHYTWWVRAVDNSGANPSAWSVPFDFSVASLPGPAPLGPIGSASSDTPTFAWSTVAGADHYDVWVNDLTTGRSAVARDQDVVGTSFTVTAPLAAGHNYRWWVRAVDGSSTNLGAWSAAADFVVSFLGQPKLVGPMGATNDDHPLLTWNAVAGADHYGIWVDDLTTGQTGVYQNNNVAGTSWSPPTLLRRGDTYRWWVRAVNSTSTSTSSWSSALDFSVFPLSTPTPTGPGSTITSAAPAFTWTAVAGADHYDVWVNDLTTGESAVLRNRNLSGTTWTPTVSLSPGHRYRWWVRAVDSTGAAAGSWSNPLDFMVASLAAPTLVGPAGASTNAAPTFVWNATAGADHYDVWVADLTTGQSSVLRQEDAVAAAWTPATPLAAGDRYRWWARAVDSTNTNYSAWSSPLDFVVSLLAAPTLIGPKDSALVLAPTFAWTAVPGADHYEIWVNDVTTGQSSVLRNKDIAGTAWTPAIALHSGDSYLWWVRAVDNSGGNNSAWSAPLQFTVTAVA